jgi:molybdopterin/thiamine biosynthesis adenylyltransferase
MLLLEGVAFRGSDEPAVFALASHAKLLDKTLLLIKKIIPLPDHAYVDAQGHGAKWQGRAMLPILNEALAEDLGVLIFHSHPHPGPVRLSGDDRQSASRLLPVFQTINPGRPHASIVLGETHTAGMVLKPESSTFLENVKVRWLGRIVNDFTCHEDTSAPAVGDVHRAQALLIGGVGQNKIRRARAAVVGLSGGGSHVVQQLAHIGIGTIAGIDNDRVESSNRSRLIGMTARDSFFRRRKTTVMARMVRRINSAVQFIPVPDAVPKQEAIEAIKESDIVVGCLDNYHARADVQEIAWRYMIPYVDIGLSIRPNNTGSGVAIGGNVLTLVPGRFCQWCIDFLSDEKLAAETGGRPRSYFQGSEKQAQVVSMNGVLASQAVNEVLQLLTGFAPTVEDMGIKKFDGLDGTLTKWRVKNKAECQMCGRTLGAGDTVWRPA